MSAKQLGAMPASGKAKSSGRGELDRCGVGEELLIGLAHDVSEASRLFVYCGSADLLGRVQEPIESK